MYGLTYHRFAAYVGPKLFPRPRKNMTSADNIMLAVAAKLKLTVVKFRKDFFFCQLKHFLSSYSSFSA